MMGSARAAVLLLSLASVTALRNAGFSTSSLRLSSASATLRSTSTSTSTTRRQLLAAPLPLLLPLPAAAPLPLLLPSLETLCAAALQSLAARPTRKA